MRRTIRLGAVLGVVWGAALAVQRSLRRVRGDSMRPTLAPGDLLLTVPRTGVPRRGDVVVARDPRDPSHAQVKRVVGLPGETVQLRGGRLLVDGRWFREPYRHGHGPDGRLQVPPGHVALLGDAREASTDSRSYGPVPLELVDRRALLVLRGRPRRLADAPVPLASVTDARRTA